MMLRSMLSRRSFLICATAVGGGLALDFALPFGAPAGGADETAEITAWIVIQPDETVIIRVARSELGQGALTALPMLVAEELECDWARVKPELVAPQENLRRSRVWGDMSTGASRSVSAAQEDLRRAGATAREMLITAAAAQWGVPAGACKAAAGEIRHAATGRSVSFGRIAASAANVEPPATVTLKDPSEWRLIGTPRARFDVPDKIQGKAVYGIDVQLPNMLRAAIRQSPVFQGQLRAVDAASAQGHRVVQLPDAVAVVADTWWEAKEAVERLHVTWDDADNAAVSSHDIAAQLREGLGAADADVGRQDGDVVTALAAAATRIEADYAAPFLAHATMEPQNCTAHVTPGRVEIWVPTQDGEAALGTAAAAAGVAESQVIVHKTMVGGGFGRRGAIQDYVQQAVLIAKEIGQPVQLVWSREEDIGHDLYRPIAMARMTAGLDAGGMPVAWKVRLAGQSLLASMAPEIMTGSFDRQFLEGLLEDMPYGVPNYLADYAMRNTPVPVGPWRAVNHSQNAFFKESFVDEMAHAAGQDPFGFRRRLLEKKPKFLAVLDAAARAANWDAPLPSGTGRGIAINESNGSICAQVVEASVDATGNIRVLRVVSALDPGHVVDPRVVAMQTEGAIAYALTAALYGEISISGGRVEQSNFHDYPILRMSEMPQVETVLVPSHDGWGGCGEPPLPPLAPALCNAIFAATGRRIRSLPIKNHALRG